MSFVLLEKKNRGAIGILPKEVSILASGINLGSEISEDFIGFDYVEVYMDYENKKIGFKASNNKRGFSIKIEKSKVKSSIRLNKYVAPGRYLATREGTGLWIVKVKEMVKS